MGDTFNQTPAQRAINNAVGSAASSAADGIAVGIANAPSFLGNLVMEASELEHKLVSSISMNNLLALATAIAAVAMIGYYYGVVILIIIVLFILSFLFMKGSITSALQVAGGTVASAALDAISTTASVTTQAVGAAVAGQ